MRSAIWGGWVAMLLVSCGGPPKSTPSAPLDMEQLFPPDIFVLDGIGLDLPDDDLEPLRALVGDAEYVGIGEPVHGSGGFLQMRSRLSAFLIKEMGFRAFGLEMPAFSIEPAEHYIQTGEGFPLEIVGGWYNMAGMEVVAWLEWLREFNIDHPDDPVHLYGFDVLSGPEDRLFLEQELAGLPSDTADLQDGLRQCIGGNVFSTDEFYATPDIFDGIDEYTHDKCLAAIDGADAAFEPTGKTVAQVIAVNRLRIWEVMWWEVITAGESGFDATRDLGLGYMAQLLREAYYPEARVILDAHNYHLIFNSTDLLGHEAAGSYLREDLGSKYYAIAAVGYDVSFHGYGRRVGDGPPHASDALEVALHELDRDFLLVDLNPPTGSLPFVEPNREYEVAWSGIGMVPADHWDAVVYLEESPAMGYIGQ